MDKPKTNAVSSWGFSGYLEVLPPEQNSTADKLKCVDRSERSSIKKEKKER
jgi:hypothetical protein